MGLYRWKMFWNDRGTHKCANKMTVFNGCKISCKSLTSRTYRYPVLCYHSTSKLPWSIYSCIKQQFYCRLICELYHKVQQQRLRLSLQDTISTSQTAHKTYELHSLHLDVTLCLFIEMAWLIKLRSPTPQARFSRTLRFQELSLVSFSQHLWVKASSIFLQSTKNETKTSSITSGRLFF